MSHLVKVGGNLTASCCAICLKLSLSPKPEMSRSQVSDSLEYRDVLLFRQLTTSTANEKRRLYGLQTAGASDPCTPSTRAELGPCRGPIARFLRAAPNLTNPTFSMRCVGGWLASLRPPTTNMR